MVIEHRSVTICYWIAGSTGSTIIFIGIGFTGEAILAVTLHLSDTSKAAVWIAHFRSPFRMFALLPALVSLVVPAGAWGDIYKWTDERGTTVFSNVPPPESGKVKNFETVLKEASADGKVPAHTATPTEQALLARIEGLERQLQARQTTTQAPELAAPTPYGSYYPSTLPPPPPSYYGSGYSSGYASYYPTYYYPVVPTYSYVVSPAKRFISRPLLVAPRGGSFHRGGGHRARR